MTIENLKSALGSGARASKYYVSFNFPASVPISSNIQVSDVLCKATAFPGKSIGAIDVFSQGRKLPIPGDTTFTNSWNTTFYNTEDHALRRDFISWMKSLDNFQSNLHSGQPNEVMTELGVSQLDSAGNITATYTFHNVWVTEVGELTIGSDQVDTVQEYDVTFSFSDWVVGNDAIDSPLEANKATKNPTANE